MRDEPEDLRGLEPPEPMLRILAALEGGGPGPYEFILPREPYPLYPLLRVGGWRHAASHDERGVLLKVFKATPGA